MVQATRSGKQNIAEGSAASSTSKETELNCKHGFVKDFRKWRWSSYIVLVKDETTRLKRSELIEWFGSLENFESFHDQNPKTIEDLGFNDS